MAKNKNEPLNTNAQESKAIIADVDMNMEETVEMEAVIGVVTNCLLLNIRKEPKDSAQILIVVPALSELMIDQSKSTDKWFSVCTEAGIEGFCMKKFVTIKL